MEAAMSAIAGGLGVIVLGLVSLVWRSKNGGATAQTQIDLVKLNGFKIDTIATALEGQHETLKEMLQVQRETKEAIITNGRG